MSRTAAPATKPQADAKPQTTRPSAVQPGTGANLPATAEPGKAPHPLVAFKSYMEERMGEVALALPPHMTAERFGRVVLTALQRTPTLLTCTRQSLFNSCMLAAQDGLLPDGREGAIVPYANGKADQAQWMPMIEGLRKKARNSGDISNWEAHIVRQKDQFEVVLGDSPRIDHKPYMGAEEPGPIVAAYSVAWLKDGTISRDVMTVRDLEKIRGISKAKNGPWSNPIFVPEMYKKTVARRHYKQLPHSAEMDDFIRRLDEAEGFADVEAGAEARQHQRVASTSAAFDAFAGAGGPVIEHDAPAADQPQGEQQTGDALADFSDDQPQDHGGQQQPTDQGGAETEAGSGEPDAGQGDGDEGKTAKQEAATWPADKKPTNPDEYQQFANAHIAAETSSEAIANWFKGAEQRQLRNACAVGKDVFDAVRLTAANRIADINAAAKAKG